MEERVSSSPRFTNPNINDIQPGPPPPALRSSETYIVHIPKDQVYRVPPLENALIVERYRSNLLQNKRSFSFLCKFFIFILIAIVAVIVALLVYYLAVNPKNPTFMVEHVVMIIKDPKLHQRHNHHDQYHITLKATNPNARLGIDYQKGGKASLSFKKQKLATGEPPTLHHGFKDTKILSIMLISDDTDVMLLNEMQRSMKSSQASKKGVSLSLLVEIPVKMKTGLLKAWSKDMVISCNMRLNKLGKDTHILSQNCQTKAH